MFDLISKASGSCINLPSTGTSSVVPSEKPYTASVFPGVKSMISTSFNSFAGVGGV